MTQLFCSPENSEPFWRRIGFLNFPGIPYQSTINMYKTLVDTLNASKEESTKSVIKLWNCEPYQARGVEPKWIWNLSFLEDGETLTKPIIFPVYRDWQIELTLPDRNNILDKIKYSGVDSAAYGSFMIIRKINV
ncbi:hypothetical protein OOZ15_07910 [Galbibacter sp. EGI 63066]|uniref:hypothetical protein n=1 Tax=Galbibacter sp. EGI 63066 TaxID=2993559 RepID=UPI00224976DE|nr:hypothetical protein [Galbibacter sp. EGI 63066]MCX2679857.1 hypothetical protein [Galbibacter sp. EGI 63066]